MPGHHLQAFSLILFQLTIIKLRKLQSVSVCGPAIGGWVSLPPSLSKYIVAVCFHSLLWQQILEVSYLLWGRMMLFCHLKDTCELRGKQLLQSRLRKRYCVLELTRWNSVNQAFSVAGSFILLLLLTFPFFPKQSLLLRVLQ